MLAFGIAKRTSFFKFFVAGGSSSSGSQKYLCSGFQLLGGNRFFIQITVEQRLSSGLQVLKFDTTCVLLFGEIEDALKHDLHTRCERRCLEHLPY